jgi:hypothetical protein
MHMLFASIILIELTLICFGWATASWPKGNDWFLLSSAIFSSTGFLGPSGWEIQT